MKIVNDDLIASYRKRGRCLWCSEMVNLCAAHLFSKGAGQVDLPFNLISLGQNAVVDCSCHQDSHYSQSPGRDKLLAINARLYKTTPQAIEDVVQWVRRLPKGSSRERVFEAMGELDSDAEKLAMQFVDSITDGKA